MRFLTIAFGVILIAVLIAAATATYTVNERSSALVLRFGDPVRVINEIGDDEAGLDGRSRNRRRRGRRGGVSRSGWSSRDQPHRVRRRRLDRIRAPGRRELRRDRLERPFDRGRLLPPSA